MFKVDFFYVSKREMEEKKEIQMKGKAKKSVSKERNERKKARKKEE